MKINDWQARAETAEKALADVREVVKKGWFVPEHNAICRSMPYKSCCCNADIAAAYRTEARQLLGLEPKP